MGFRKADRVKETTTTTGTGTLNLEGAVAGFQTFVAGIGTGHVCTYCIENGTDWEIGEGTVTDATPDTLSRNVLQSSNADALVDWAAGTKNVFCVYAAIDPNPNIKSLSSGYTNSSTTGTEVTSLSFNSLQPGHYFVRWQLLIQAAATTTSPKFGVNVTGTVGAFVANAYFPSSGVNAVIGQITDAVNATTGQIWGYSNTRTESTTAPNLGPWTGVVNVNVDCLCIVECMVALTGAGDIELWAGSEVGSSQIQITAGSIGILFRATEG